jgi:hypothetical protein
MLRRYRFGFARRRSARLFRCEEGEKRRAVLTIDVAGADGLRSSQIPRGSALM